jgi:hypothetical protein
VAIEFRFVEFRSFVGLSFDRIYEIKVEVERLYSILFCKDK